MRKSFGELIVIDKKYPVESLFMHGEQLAS